MISVQKYEGVSLYENYLFKVPTARIQCGRA